MPEEMSLMDQLNYNTNEYVKKNKGLPNNVHMKSVTIVEAPLLNGTTVGAGMIGMRGLWLPLKLGTLVARIQRSKQQKQPTKDTIVPFDDTSYMIIRDVD